MSYNEENLLPPEEFSLPPADLALFDALADGAGSTTPTPTTMPPNER